MISLKSERLAWEQVGGFVVVRKAGKCFKPPDRLAIVGQIVDDGGRQQWADDHRWRLIERCITQCVLQYYSILGKLHTWLHRVNSGQQWKVCVIEGNRPHHQDLGTSDASFLCVLIISELPLLIYFPYWLYEKMTINRVDDAASVRLFQWEFRISVLKL